MDVFYNKKVYKKYPLLKPDEIIEIFKEIERGDNSRRNLIYLSNLRLVIKEAAKIVSTIHLQTLDMDDLIQSGIFGLHQAIEKYDYKKGFRFSTYATWWIKQKIQRSICDTNTNIRLPFHVNQLRSYVKGKIANYLQTFKKQPTMNEIYSLCSDKYKPDKIDKYWNLVTDNVFSLNTSFLNKQSDGASHKNTSDEILDFVADENNENPFDSTHKILLKEKVAQLIERLIDPRYKRILIMRFGLDGGSPLTLLQIGKIEKISRERVRQIVIKALKQIRQMLTIEEIKSLKEGL